MAAKDQSSTSGNSGNGGNSNAQLLVELEALSQSLYQSHTTRRTASLALPRSPAAIAGNEGSGSGVDSRPRGRRLSLSPWRSRPGGGGGTESEVPKKPARKLEAAAGEEKKGIWGWKPMRAISHIGMQRIGCLFSVEVVAAQELPATMNGLRLAVCVRKKESRDGTVQTMPARVAQGAADFDETLFIKCHVYCSGGGDKPLKFEPRPFMIYVAAIDAEELDFGRSSVDLSLLIQESMEKNLQGTRIRQWDTSFDLAGKAKGGELVLKLGFQIIEDKGVGIYKQGENLKAGNSPNFARKQSKTSFSVQSPRLAGRFEASTPSKGSGDGRKGNPADFHGIDELDLNEPAPPPPTKEVMEEELDLPQFEVVDKGIEFQDKRGEGGGGAAAAMENSSPASMEIVKEVVHDPVHQRRLTELDSIAQQIKALESMIQPESPCKIKVGKMQDGLYADEECVTREFLQLLENEQGNGGVKLDFSDEPQLKSATKDENENDSEKMVFVPDLGKGLQSVVQTRDGGFLAAMNPYDVQLSRKEMPKLAMQISKPLVLPLGDLSSVTGFELFQKLAGIGATELRSTIQTAAAMDELMGKTAEQIAFEGIACAIIQGRGKEEGASSSAARSVAAVKAMAAAVSTGREERIRTGLWNVREEAVTLEEILPFSVQKIEAMVVEALKIQADLTDEEAPFDMSPLRGNKDPRQLITSANSLEEQAKERLAGEAVTVMVVVQARDPLRRYEAVGGPVLALIQANQAQSEGEEVEKRFKVKSLHVGGLRMQKGGDSERQRLTAMQWVVAYGLGKVGTPTGAGKKASTRQAQSGKMVEALWSISARVMADMWLKSMRNPDVKFLKKDVFVDK